MTGRRDWAVRCVALVCVLTSVAALIGSDRLGHRLPIPIINVAVIAAAAAFGATLVHSTAPDNSLWRVLLAGAVVGPVAVLLLAVTQAQHRPGPVLVGAAWLLDVPLTRPWTLFFGLFPDGHRPFRTFGRWVAGSAVLHAAVAALAWASAPDARWPIQGHLPGARTGTGGSALHVLAATSSSALTGLLPAAAALTLVRRYRRSGPVVRQQIRIGMAALAATVLLEFELLTLPGAGSWPVRIAISVAAVGVGVLGVAAALLRWRLWVIDRALPRAALLSGCSVLVTVVMVCGALAATGSIGVRQVRRAVLVAILISLLVQGYGRRLEPWVRRRIYGPRPGGFAVLLGLADGLTGLDTEAAAVLVTDAAHRGLSVPWAALWTPTARPGLHRLAARSGPGPEAASLRLEIAWPPGRARLVTVDPGSELPADTAAVTVLATADGPWALLAVGQRRGEPLTVGDLELLDAITREAGLARANRRLSVEVAASIAELHRRAELLQLSRQRLVAAQDEERRRIERDLHDGAQHDLVALAARLRQLAREPSTSGAALDEVADQAERAVFSLQDLARGIYPSVLTDSGVAAAIRSYVGRLPHDIALHVEPELLLRRWPAELEIALYFVLVEALGNMRKHARAGRTAVTLAADHGDLVLEIHDDGVGFDPAGVRRGGGLAHMADRMAAVGATVTVASSPGNGTWITARVAQAGLPQTPAGTPAPPAPVG